MNIPLEDGDGEVFAVLVDVLPSIPGTNWLYAAIMLSIDVPAPELPSVLDDDAPVAGAVMGDVLAI